MSTYETLKNTFKVIYSPSEAFKQISQNPKFIGPILIMILFVTAYTGSRYILLSKMYEERTLPTVSQRTENSTLWIENPWIENSSLWTSNANSVNYSDDYIKGGSYGNKSIEFTFVNDAQVWMQLNKIGPVNCSELTGYKNMSIRAKLIQSNMLSLKNASLYLYSSPDEFFCYNLTAHFVSFDNNTWINLTVPVGPENQYWMYKSMNADWGNITDLRFEFTWLENASLTMRLNALFFRGIFRSPMENATSYMVNYSFTAFTQFVIKWVLLGGIIYIMTKAFKAKTFWKPVLILVGIGLITMFIQALINAAAFSALPTIHYPFEYFAGTKAESQIASSVISGQIGLVSDIYQYVQLGILIWTVMLCALVTRLLAEFSWSKSLLIATVACFVPLFIFGF